MLNEENNTLSDWVETLHACLVAAGGSEDVDELELQMGGMDPSEFVRSQFEKALAKTDKTPMTKEWLDAHFPQWVEEVIYHEGWTAWDVGIDTFGRRCVIRSVKYMTSTYTEFYCGRHKIQMISNVGHVYELLTAFGIEVDHE
jgi:hypothetical protein